MPLLFSHITTQNPTMQVSVYILVKEVDYESAFIYGVYTSRSSAITAAEKKIEEDNYSSPFVRLDDYVNSDNTASIQWRNNALCTSLWVYQYHVEE